MSEYKPSKKPLPNKFGFCVPEQGIGYISAMMIKSQIQKANYYGIMGKEIVNIDVKQFDESLIFNIKTQGAIMYDYSEKINDLDKEMNK